MRARRRRPRWCRPNSAPGRRGRTGSHRRPRWRGRILRGGSRRDPFVLRCRLGERGSSMSTVKTGDDHLASLRDGRSVFIDGARVDDVTSHRAFRNAVGSAARLYDFQADPAQRELMTFASPDAPRRVSRCWQLPHDHAELVTRRRALEAWAQTHYGFLGRSPDHVASCIGGMVMGLDLFQAYDPRRAAALRDY